MFSAIAHICKEKAHKATEKIGKNVPLGAAIDSLPSDQTLIIVKT
jgi:hypothetical protein